MKSSLTLVGSTAATAGNTALAVRAVPVSGQTPAQSASRTRFSGLSQAFKALTWQEKATWQEAANTLSLAQGRTTRRKLSACAAYTSLNGALLSIGFTTNATAPLDLSAPPALEGITVVATYGAGGFHLRLVSPGYLDPVWILAAPPVAAGKNTFPKASFKQIGSLDELVSGTGNAITALYTAAYGAPGVGAQIALTLVGTSPAGVRRNKLVVLGIVTAA